MVADEVRKLAERTSMSTTEIAGMVEKIQNGTRNAVASMQTGVTQADKGVALANEAGQSIVSIRDGALRVVDVVNDISSSIREQSAASKRHCQEYRANCPDVGRKCAGGPARPMPPVTCRNCQRAARLGEPLQGGLSTAPRKTRCPGIAFLTPLVPGVEETIEARPACLTWYMAASACRTTSWTSEPSSG